jgi:hypothetical protein
MKSTTIAIDLAKNIFQIDMEGVYGKVLVRKHFKRADMSTYWLT